MKFTEREMTLGVRSVAQHLMLASKPFARGGVAERWDRLAPMERYEKLSAAGELVLPVLVALPERPTVGASPTFTDDEWRDAAMSALAERSEKKRLVTLVVRLGRIAVAAMPVRQDPDALVVPDHL